MRQLLGLLLLAATVGVISGLALSTPTTALAQGGGACNLNSSNCNPADATVTSAITVTHAYPNGPVDDPVEPDTGETWEITASYQLVTTGTACDCDDRSDTVTVDVDWNETTDSWDATCTGCGGGSPIQAVNVCHVSGCGTHTTIDNAWVYELIVDVNHNHLFNCGVDGPQNSNLIEVDFETTSVDDGDTIRTGNCTEQTSVSPTSQTFAATDDGPWECLFTCAAAIGESVTITYE